tara:strand:+ start:55 stop:264 length:210 start_codon:yes stop_codon:yes gene_type:complete
MKKPKFNENSIISGGKVGIKAELFNLLGKYEMCINRINARPEINATTPRENALSICIFVFPKYQLKKFT